MNEIKLQRRLQELEQIHDGTFATTMVDLDHNSTFDWRGDRVNQTASTFKLFVLCELFRQAMDGQCDLSAPLAWDDRHQRSGDGVLRAFAPGDRISAYNLAVLMMIVSDNVATARLVDLVGAKSVMATMQAWGLSQTDLFHGLSGDVNAATILSPVSSPRDMCRLITSIYRRDYLTPAICDDIIRIMRAQRCNDMLPRLLPVGEDWGDAPNWIANKTGYGQARVEVGIVHIENRTFALAMFFQSNNSAPWNRKCLADYPPVRAVGEACYALFEDIITADSVRAENS